MRIYFFSRTDKSGRFAFRSYYSLQNLRNVKAISLIYFIFTLIIRFLLSFHYISNQTLHHINEYDKANWISLIVTPCIYLISLQLVKRFSTKEGYLRLVQFFVFAFALFIITNSMRVTFFSMYNPRNTMLPYMVGLVIVGTFYTFEYFETIIIVLATGLIFSFMLPFYQSAVNELVLNNLASVLLLTVFFCISRYIFSYRADNFFKIKAIEEKNIEIENASNAKN